MHNLHALIARRLAELDALQTDDLDKFRELIQKRIATIMTDVDAQLEKVFALQDVIYQIDFEACRRGVPNYGLREREQMPATGDE